MEEIDLGVCEAQYFTGDPARVGILLPGAEYLPAAPLLWFAREVLQAQGWSVLQVWDRWDRSAEPRRWVDERFRAAVDHVGLVDRRVLITKSLTSLALPAANSLGLAGVWLTPLLNRDDVRGALAVSASPTLAIGGTADPAWDSEFVGDLANIEILEIAGADHLLQRMGDPAASIASLGDVAQRIGSFVARLA